VLAQAGERGALRQAYAPGRHAESLAALLGWAKHDNPLILRCAFEQPLGLEPEDRRMHRLPRDLDDAGELGGRKLGPGLEHAQDRVLLRGQPDALESVLQQQTEALVRQAEEVAQVRFRGRHRRQGTCQIG
jgi:hypothetical protein